MPPPARIPNKGSGEPPGGASATFTVTVIVVVATFPDVSVALAVIVFEPACRVRFVDHDVASEAIPVAVIVKNATIAPSSGDEIVTLGGVVSGGNGVTDTSGDIGPSPIPFTALTR